MAAYGSQMQTTTHAEACHGVADHRWVARKYSMVMPLAQEFGVLVIFLYG
jgi:hypothetical protein